MPPPAGGRLMGPASSGEQRGPAMTSDAPPSTTLRDTMRAGVRDLSAIWWWFLILGVLWTWFGMYVLSYRVGSLAAVAALVREWRWLFIVAGILGVAAAVVTFAWPGRTLYVVSILVAWYLIILGVSEIFAAFSLREAGKRVERLID